MSGSVKINTNLLVLFVLAFAAFFVYVVVNSSSSGKFSMNSGPNSITLELSDQKIDFLGLIDSAMEDKNKAHLLLSKLKNDYEIYDVNSDELVDYLRRLSPNEKISQEILNLLFEGAGPFDYQFHAYRNIYSLSTVNEILKADYQSEVAQGLRDAADEGVGIFKKVALPVRVGFAPESRISDGQAAVCTDSEYRGRNIMLFNDQGIDRNIVSVNAFNHFVCITEESVGDADQDSPLIQVNFKTARNLFGNIKLNKTEPALLYLVPIGFEAKVDNVIIDIASNLSVNALR